MTEQEMSALILRASQTPSGIEIETNDTDAFKQLFYKTQKKLGVKFKLHTSPTPNRLWIIPHEAGQSNP